MFNIGPSACGRRGLVVRDEKERDGSSEERGVHQGLQQEKEGEKVVDPLKPVMRMSIL